MAQIDIETIKRIDKEILCTLKCLLPIQYLKKKEGLTSR